MASIAGSFASGISRPIFALAFLFYLLFIPEQFNTTIFGMYISPYRIFLIGSSVFVIRHALQSRIVWAWPDLLIVVGVFWIWLSSYFISGEVSVMFARGGAHFIDIALGYFLVRASISTSRDFRHFLVLIAPAVATIGLIVAIESVSHRLFVSEIASAITGVSAKVRYDVRMGLARGVGPFPHPILCGIFLASFLPIYLISGLRGWPKVAGALGSVGAVFTMSTAAALGLNLGVLLLGYDWFTERFRNVTWSLFVSFGGMLYLAVEIASNSGAYGLMVRYVALNAGSAYNRVLIWRFGTESILQNPWLGIGYDDWDRPMWMHSGSFDHFWLILALRFGIPALVCFLLASLLALAMIMRRSTKSTQVDARLMRGVAISLAIFVIGVCSVSLWLAPLVWFFMLVGVGVSLAVSPEARTALAPPQPPAIHLNRRPRRSRSSPARA
ncbi:MAG: hypothetical protein QNI87_12665 [Erythrobacter sp.]|uniref:O-antigen ligase family protein n=1 Tax=Erythrobacter sp. TaxID=1042 RepID=UPI0026085B2A|nr:O-antigen ligase family protein [Erythrobacter sp.]MDJ0979371.1 hypothetical protein [Erythrobacter sp.]